MAVAYLSNELGCTYAVLAFNVAAGEVGAETIELADAWRIDDGMAGKQADRECNWIFSCLNGTVCEVISSCLACPFHPGEWLVRLWRQLTEGHRLAVLGKACINLAILI